MHILRAQGQPKAFSLQSQPKQIFVKPHKKIDQATKDREDVKAGGVRRGIVWRRKALGRKRGIIGQRTLSRACLHVSGLSDNCATYFPEPVGDPHSQLHPKYSPHSDNWNIIWPGYGKIPRLRDSRAGQEGTTKSFAFGMSVSEPNAQQKWLHLGRLMETPRTGWPYNIHILKHHLCI